MSQTPLETEFERSRAAGSELFVCPDCSSPLSVRPLECRHCAFEGRIRNGILSLRSATTPPDRSRRPFDADLLEPIAVRTERTSIRDATATLREDEADHSQLLSALYGSGRDAWRTFAAEEIRGRCLDVNAGFGRRSMLLAELAETVYAIEPSLSSIRIAAARDDFESGDRVVPIHTTEDRLPFADGSFDTIVADFTGRRPQTLVPRLGLLGDLLADDGTLLFLADGATTRLGLSGGLGSSADGPASGRDLRGALRGTPDGYRSLLSAAGLAFDDVALYSLFPTATRPLYVFDVESEHAVRKLSEIVLAERGRLAQVAKPFVSIGGKTGLLRRAYPSYLAVCRSSADASPAPFDASDPLLISGRSRSVVLETSSDGVDGVWKIPNRNDHVSLTDREHSIVDRLRSSDAPIVETLPAGTTVETGFGPARREEPVPGTPLAAELDGDLDSFDRVLRIGFEWLTEFQRQFGGEFVERSPAAVRDELRFEPTGIEPPAVNEPVETFETPVHGDYLAGNVHAHDGEVTGVIDWEYGATDASPIIDAGFFALDTATRTFDDFETGFERVFCDDTEYADRARSIVRQYCDDLGLPYRTFELYLPSVYLHRLELDWRFGAASTYTSRMHERTAAVEIVFDRRESIDIA
ncbi:phosphotransferase [Natrinema salaciae]|uniref:Methyltransferase domain-containing protein n=1 Tax=Natrinema salaciae TaxID=1186196 RepID=A0A1H9ABY0_9EURY|nr:phosphotransferase [Natrinema salaciae]SEP73498.1 Methyltransferase domain-containing protein [Natrinema salaciae]